MIVAVGSTNPVKVEATREILSKLYSPLDVYPVKVNSGVPPQPLSIEETIIGAKNRAKAALEKITTAEIGVGIEGGIDVISGKLYSFGAICVLTRDGVEGTGLTPFFELPEYIRERVYSGEELGKVMEEISGIKDIKLKEGAVGWFSRGLMTRKKLYCCGLRVALINLIQAGIPAKLR